MDSPLTEIGGVVLRLCTGTRAQQQETLEKYFTSDASFKHPFCAVTNDREKILRIFQWYKILSPKVEISVNSVTFDPYHELVFLNISQTFKIWFVPYYSAHVNLTSVLRLIEGHKTRVSVPANDKYYIRSQEDLYQTDEFVKFFLPWSIGTTVVGIWHWLATLLCVFGAELVVPLLQLFERVWRFWSQQPDYTVADARIAAIEQRRDSKGVQEGLQEKSGNLSEEGTVRKKERRERKSDTRAGVAG